MVQDFRHDPQISLKEIKAGKKLHKWNAIASDVVKKVKCF